MRHLEGCRTHHDGTANGHPLDHPYPMGTKHRLCGLGCPTRGDIISHSRSAHRCTYCSSPNLLSNKVCMACKASWASSPCASMVTCTPKPAASIMTPMMLLALTFCSPRAIKISLLYWAASWVSLAAARACKPSLLLMTRSIEAIKYNL